VKDRRADEPAPGAAGAEARPDLAQSRVTTKRSRAVVLGLPTVALVALLLVAEGIVRLSLPHVESLDVFVRQPLMRSDLTDRNKTRIFEGDPLLFWRLKPNLNAVVWDYTLVSTNNAGLRSERPLSAKAPGTVRILCLGDSVTFGYRVPVVFPNAPDSYDRGEAPYPVLVERGLRLANPGRAIEVVNMAVPGYSSRQALAWLRRDIGRLEPDLVTICVGWNDVSARERPDHSAMPMGSGHVLARRVVGSSQLLLRASLAGAGVGQWLGGRDGGAALVPRATDAQFVANVLGAAKVARAHRAEAVVIAPIFGGSAKPSADMSLLTVYRAELRLAATGEGIAFLEVPELTEAAFPKNAAYFPTEAIHPGFKGHRLLAQALLRLLQEEGMLASLGLAAPSAAVRESL
jgi:lysophospholipase L1-like esterase